MIRRLKSGQYRLYSRKKDPKTGKRRNLGTFRPARPPRSTSARCNTSSGADARNRPQPRGGCRLKHIRNSIAQEGGFSPAQFSIPRLLTVSARFRF